MALKVVSSLRKECQEAAWLPRNGHRGDSCLKSLLIQRLRGSEWRGSGSGGLMLRELLPTGITAKSHTRATPQWGTNCGGASWFGPWARPSQPIIRQALFIILISLRLVARRNPTAPEVVRHGGVTWTCPSPFLGKPFLGLPLAGRIEIRGCGP